RANVAELGLTGCATVVQGDVTTVDRAAFDGVVLDPARRGPHGRVFDPDQYAPPWEFVEQVLRSGPACVKVAPGIPHSRIPDGIEAEWVSEGGTVKEAALWSGRLAGEARRRATVLPGAVTVTDLDDPYRDAPD